MGEKLNIPKSLLQKLYYNEGLTQAEIAAKLGCTPKTICNRMEAYGMTARTQGDYFQIDLPSDELRELYATRGMSVEALADHFGCSAWTVLRNLRTYGIPVRPARCPARHYVPDSVYATWNAGGDAMADIAYALGALAADGNLNKLTKQVSLTSTDKEFIDLFQRCLSLTVPIYYKPRNLQGGYDYEPQYTVAFSDRDFRAFLESIGLTPVKSKTLGSLNIPDVVFADFVRGYWDGDGCWTVDRYGDLHEYLRGTLTSGSPTFLGWVQTCIERQAGLHGNITGMQLRYRSRLAIALGYWLYRAPSSEPPPSHSHVPALSRKYAIWRRFALMVSH